MDKKNNKANEELDSKGASNLPATTVKNNQPAIITNDALLEGLKNAENLPDTDFTEVQSGEFLKMEEGEVITVGYAGVEPVSDYNDRKQTKDAVVLYNGEGKKLLGTQTMLVSLCKKIVIPEGMAAVIVRICYEGKTKGQTNTYDIFKVAQL